jgi:hypothetical protein
LVVLQNPTDSENVQGLCSEICPASSHAAYEAVSIKAEVLSDIKAEELSDAEEEDYPVPVTLPGIKTEPEVSRVSMSMLGIFHIYRYSLFYELLLQ